MFSRLVLKGRNRHELTLLDRKYEGTVATGTSDIIEGPDFDI